MHTLPQLLLLIIRAKIKPIQPAIEYTLRYQTPKIIKEIRNSKYLSRHMFLSMEHFSKPACKMIAVKPQQIVPVT